MELLSYLLNLAEKEDHSDDQIQDTSSSSAMLNTSGSYIVVKLVITYK